MELKINEVQLPESYTFNYEELKNAIIEKTSLYEAMVYNEDQIRTAKADRANLNKLKKALNDERIRLEREYMKPFNDFKEKINEIISIIDRPVNVIDVQIRKYEDLRKEEKLEQIKALWNGSDISALEWMTLDMVFNDKWLNASYSLKNIGDEFEQLLVRVITDLKTINSLPEYSFEATEVYKQTLDLAKAIAEGQRLSDIQKRKTEAAARAKAEVEAKKDIPVADSPECIQPEPVSSEKEEEPRTWISFKANLSVPEALELKEFFRSRNINYKAI